MPKTKTKNWALINLRKRRKKFYQSIVSVFCPILNETIYFTSNGFIHLIYESNRMPRNEPEQYLKLSVLKYAPDVVKNSALISETREINGIIKGKQKKIYHYEIVHEVSPGKKIRVVIQRIGTGKFTFLSIMPHDNKSKRRGRTKKAP